LKDASKDLGKALKACPKVSQAALLALASDSPAPISSLPCNLQYSESSPSCACACIGTNSIAQQHNTATHPLILLPILIPMCLNPSQFRISARCFKENYFYRMEQDTFTGNRICKLLGIRHPIIQAGMVWCAGWELAAAVSNAGGLGLIGAGSMDAETLRIHIRKCKAATDQPFGVNAPLLYRHIDALMEVVAAEGVEIVFTSAGNPKAWTGQLKALGIKVVHVVSSVRFAQKAEEAGVDAVVAEGFEAGGHNGREELTTLCLVPQVRAAVGLPLLAAGGIASGAAMLACMALGADGVQIGSRFVASVESSAHPNFKELVTSLPSDGTMLAMKAVVPVRLVRNQFYEEIRQLEEKGATQAELLAHLGRGRARKGMFEGELAEGELEIGQISGAIDAILPAREIVEGILREYGALRAEIGKGMGRF
jgi:enoyl-[acyl-carrier protein] reductase II